VFAHGVFAGTISPEPMNPGRTGQGAIARFDRSGLVVRYERFADSDPSCCPTRPPVDVVFQVTDEDGGPVLLPVQSNEVQATTH
jgi:hypothetical protein